MELTQIKNFFDFDDFVKDFAANAASDYTSTLEEYLRSFLIEVEKHQAAVPSWGLFAGMIEAALTTPPVDFDPAWREQNCPEGLYHPPEEVDGYKLVYDLLLYQIASLRWLADSGKLPNEWKSLGTRLPDGHIWYNFAPAVFWECAPEGMPTSDPDEEAIWYTLANLLWFGQTYF